MNIRYIISNIKEANARELYFDLYVKRGDSSENRIKEVKNMCFSDRLSTHKYWPNFFRLLLSCVAYEFFLIIKEAIQKTKHEAAKKWQVSTIRASLLKVGARIKQSKKRIYYQFSKAFTYQTLFTEVIGNI